MLYSYITAFSRIITLTNQTLPHFTVYRPRMPPNIAISNFVSRCLDAEPPVVYGDGTKTRDLTFIGDLVEADVDLLEEDSANGEVLNIVQPTSSIFL